MAPFLARLGIGALLSVFAVGCSSRPVGAELSPVEGQVFVRGNPAVHAFVVLHPVTQADADAPRPRGQVDAQGTFRLGTHAAADGAPPGDYVVTIQWYDNSRSKTDDNRGPNPQSDLLRGRYSDPRHPKALRVRINTGPTTLPPFRL